MIIQFSLTVWLKENHFDVKEDGEKETTGEENGVAMATGGMLEKECSVLITVCAYMQLSAPVKRACVVGNKEQYADYSWTAEKQDYTIWSNNF